ERVLYRARGGGCEVGRFVPGTRLRPKTPLDTYQAPFRAGWYAGVVANQRAPTFLQRRPSAFPPSVFRILLRRRPARQDDVPVRPGPPGPRPAAPEPAHRPAALPRRPGAVPPRRRGRLRVHARLVLAGRPLPRRGHPVRPGPRP